ncbi:NAD(P)-dependent alcohol dehydrogenase [Agrobacterium vitis]|uniref:Alcohol dehydrogenase catalytic domain-containing protein n=1 Tax=Agrobacterium vitis TaxID=373 RepID=A0AAE4WA40_AGRVI|nr:NAD(P)-dependent alcohol dehydrogenase [Agrobacterium vitis]MCF1498398.1 NAD(P)-dependent alcohol dehydrogenase [Allorhizobium sp. Av2]MCM2438483.1 NAD(P)-dependent alcohol dehydrogenase [Agrobacterium vitis]MUZ56134.1 alcohol dehydrogenase catalytic domain-containing protein [Agrobacterium vitis]MVA64728.1 alcohol dehydrogenase catalytic domain-containing protein [Agrobacterium vitis]MVA85699.1 alcohol dehydrogenase catalytic domain-containing protein [Agrobacterium vitis]
MPIARGYAATDASKPLEPFTFERREPNDDDVVISIKYCGVCHSDIHQARNEWGNSAFPMVPGHEIAGVVTAVGANVSKFKVGDPVGVGCFVDSCVHCQERNEDIEQYLPGLVQTYNGVDRDGKTATQGGYSDTIVVKEGYVLSIPDNLPLDKAAPLLCAGITLYSPLAHWKAGPGKKVAIVGMGGLGHMGVKIGAAMGAEITVLSQTLSKKEDGLRLGASHYYATSDAKTFETLSGSFDLIICTVSADIDWNAYLNLLKVDGTMVLLGVPEKPVPVHAFSLIPARRNLAGSMIGSIKETQDMLDFCGKHGITSDIELIDIKDINTAYERVLKSDVRYRFVIDMATLAA